jgi:hypothetical protein
MNPVKPLGKCESIEKRLAIHERLLSHLRLGVQQQLDDGHPVEPDRDPERRDPARVRLVHVAPGLDQLLGAADLVPPRGVVQGVDLGRL